MRSHPVYIIPNDLPETQLMCIDAGDICERRGRRGLYVYATSLPPEAQLPEMLDLDDNRGTLGDLMPLYTPTDAEVVRALRGPMGPTGPMGPQGVAA